MITFLYLVIIFCVFIISFALGWLVCFYTVRPAEAVRFAYVVHRPISKKRGGDLEMLEVKITNEQKVRIDCNPVTATGNPAALDGPLTITPISGDSTVEMIDEKSFYLISSATPGDTEFLVEADADLGEGVVPISDIVKLTVEGALAANLGLVAGTPEPK